MKKNKTLLKNNQTKKEHAENEKRSKVLEKENFIVLTKNSERKVGRKI